MTWFGNDPFPPLVLKCMKSWKRYLPDYQIMIWTKDNYNLNINPWVSEAYSAKKYAFVSDFARFDVLYNYGGVYLDSDVEILKSLNNLLYNHAFAGFMTIPNIIEGEVIGAEKGHPFLQKMMSYYQNKHFNTPNGDLNMKPLPEIIFDILNSEQVILEPVDQNVFGVHLYPPGFFVYHRDVILVKTAYDTMYSYHYGAGLGWRLKNNGISGKIFHSYVEHGLDIIKLTKKIGISKIHKKIILFLLKNLD